MPYQSHHERLEGRQRLALSHAPAEGIADGGDDINHLYEIYFAYSLASNTSRGIFLLLGIISFITFIFSLVLLIRALEWEGVALQV